MSAKPTQRKEWPGLKIVRVAMAMAIVTGLSIRTMINEGNYILFTDTEMRKSDKKTRFYVAQNVTKPTRGKKLAGAEEQMGKQLGSQAVNTQSTTSLDYLFLLYSWHSNS